MVTVIERINNFIGKQVNIAPLVVFRIAFGGLMFISLLRFIFKGWVYQLYILPKVYFPFFDFPFLSPLPGNGMYAVFWILLACSVFIILGLFYRFSITIFFLLFTYVELIDKTNYLNHYYFICLISFLLVFVPAANAFSLDNYILKRNETEKVPVIYVLMIQMQMAIVYFFAGVAKLNSDWLFNAMPLKIWLPPYSHWPIIGPFLETEWVAYFFSWFGCIYDLAISFLLFNKKTVKWGYFLVLVFHLATSLFFNIGMFPYIMMVITIIFFSEDFHLKILTGLKQLFRYNTSITQSNYELKPIIKTMAIIYLIIQVILPFRYLAYNQNLFWCEQGYRFSWRVMLMEKAGTAFFYVKDAKTKNEVEVDNKKYLTYMQEKQMSTQPDMMVDYAKFLKNEFQKQGFTNPSVRALVYVTLNGQPSRKFINDSIDLSIQSNSIFKKKTWILN